MPEYRTPLPAMLAAFLEAGINRLVSLDPATAQRMEKLEGKLLLVVLEGVGIELFVTFEFGNVLVSLDSDREPDTELSGSPAALFAMAAPEEISNWGLPGSGVKISGDANLARDLGRVFQGLDMNLEGPLSSILGDTLGFQVAAGIRQGAESVVSAAKTGAKMAGDYVRDDASMLLTENEFRTFSDSVDQLRDSTDRLEARLEGLEPESSPDEENGKDQDS